MNGKSPKLQLQKEARPQPAKTQQLAAPNLDNRTSQIAPPKEGQKHYDR